MLRAGSLWHNTAWIATLGHENISTHCSSRPMRAHLCKSWTNKRPEMKLSVVSEAWPGREGSRSYWERERSPRME